MLSLLAKQFVWCWRRSSNIIFIYSLITFILISQTKQQNIGNGNNFLQKTIVIT